VVRTAGASGVEGAGLDRPEAAFLRVQCAATGFEAPEGIVRMPAGTLRRSSRPFALTGARVC
jgi:hypothetical protein